MVPLHTLAKRTRRRILAALNGQQGSCILRSLVTILIMMGVLRGGGVISEQSCGMDDELRGDDN